MKKIIAAITTPCISKREKRPGERDKLEKRADIAVTVA
jgi:hypothetical protein